MNQSTFGIDGRQVTTPCMSGAKVNLIRSAVFALACTAAVTTNAAVITFDSVTNSLVMTGETIGSTAEVDVTYQGDFRGWSNNNAEFPDGDGASGGTIYATTIAGVGGIILTAKPGYLVQLDSVVLRMPTYGNPSSSGALDYTYDGITYYEVPTNVANGATGLFNIGAAPAAAVALRWRDDPSGLGSEASAGLDNITFTTVPVPEPGTLVLGSLATVAFLGFRRRCR